MMSGIYIHIPFCVQRCHYCDFFSSTRLELREQFISACLREIEVRADYLKDKEINSIYFGGGTPSLLDLSSFERIFDSLSKHFNICQDSEITIEANPDDLDKDILDRLKSCGFNRISIGIQSFRQEDLLLMNRRHSVDQALKSVALANSSGFNSIGVDLIYGLPGLSNEDWLNNLSMIKDLPIDHLSAYHLTIEQGTAFGKWLNEGKIREMDENDSLKQYKMLVATTKEMGFEHYEISNFARNQKYSRHNMKYWAGDWYLGLGPSAHSFNGAYRHWNPASLQKYITAYSEGENITEFEEVSLDNRINELIMTSLRTKWGIYRETWNALDSGMGWEELVNKGAKYLDSGDMRFMDDRLIIHPESWFRADGIIADLFSLSEHK